MSARLTDKTADRIFQMIMTDPHLEPGQKLPNEAELCQLFGVSRNNAARSRAFAGCAGVCRSAARRGTFVADRASLSAISACRSSNRCGCGCRICSKSA